VGLSWNPGQLELALLTEQGAKELGVSCQILILNSQEWQQVAGVQAELLAMVPEIIVTDGKQGGWWYYRGQRQGEYRSPEVTSVDDTGAGDAFAAGYVAARLAERQPSEALRWGTHNAAAAVQQVGAKPGLLTWSQLEKMVQEHD
jgi:ribokinase